MKKKKKFKNNIIIFSDYFMKKRIIKEGKIYNNKVFGECCECGGNGIIFDPHTDMVCISCGGTGITYFGNVNIN